MRVYRIEREKYLPTTLQGIGASKMSDFRWNSRNTFLVYTSASRALATLEVAMHLDLSEDLPTDRFYVEIDIPDEIAILTIELQELPELWDNKPPITLTQSIGDTFVEENAFAVLRVPSSIVPLEDNYLINPNHIDAKKIKVISQSRMRFDNRIKP